MPQKVRRNVPISPPVGKIFEKAYILFQFCSGTGGLTGLTTSRGDIRGAPTVCLKTMPNRARAALFCAGVDLRRGERCWDCSPIAELSTIVCNLFFEITPTG